MSKIMTRLFAGAVVGSAVLGAAATESSAQAPCGTEAACSRYMACPGTKNSGYTSLSYDLSGTVALGNAIACKGLDAPRDPTCSAKNLRGDWVFSKTTKECCRGAAGERTCSKENIDCRKEYAYNASTGLCEDSTPRWTRVVASTVPYSDNSSANSYAEAKQTVTCPSGYALTGGSPTNKRYVCEKATNGYVESVPTCQGAGFSWDASSKQCCGSTSLAAPRTCSTTGITCPTGATYISFKGMCRTPTAALYAAPVLN